MNKKTIAIMLACAMLMGTAVGGAIAWLTGTTDEVVNTFTVGDINISLTETDAVKNGDKLEKNYDFVPGDTLLKDPTVTVDKNSEACWLFVKVTVTNNSYKDTTITPNVESVPVVIWEIADGWTPYGTNTNAPRNGTYYYYRSVTEDDLKMTEGENVIAKDGVYQVLKCKDTTHTECAGCVKIDEHVTKGMVSAMGINGTAKPSLTFEAAAVQSANIVDVDTAFAETGWSTPGN